MAQVVLYEWPGIFNDSGRNQRPMTGIDDVDGDGVTDLLIGRPDDSTFGLNAGRADVVSGRDGSVIRSMYGTAARNGLGGGTSRLDDIDGDGVEDFAVGAPWTNFSQPNFGLPYIRIFSGRTGALLRQIDSTTPYRFFGAVLRRTPDVDGDGVGELLVGAFINPYPGSSVVDLISCTTGAILREWDGGWGNLTFGMSVDAIGDIDGDGITEIIVGSSDEYPSHPEGSARVYSAATGAQLSVIWGSSQSEEFGTTVAGLGDLDNDGVPDFAIGSPGFNGTNARVEVRSGSNSALLYAIVPGAQTGWTIEPLEDEDGDGAKDFVIQVFDAWPGTSNSLRVVSGRTGATIESFAGTPELPIGRVIVDAGDLNGDGRRDLLLNRHEPYPSQLQHVDVLLLGVEQAQRYCTAKPNSLGCVPVISSSSAASLSVGDNFIVRASNVLNAKPGVLLWSASPLNAPFAGGTLCVSPTPPSIRGPVLDSGGSPPNVTDCTGAYAFHFSHALMNSRGLTAGTTLYAQFLSRDNGFAPPRNIGLTDALRFTVVP